MNRRGLVSGLGALFICAPAIVRVSSLMPLSIQPRSIAFNLIPEDVLVPLFYVEADELDPNRVNVFIKQEYIDQLKVVAKLVEANVELA